MKQIQIIENQNENEKKQYERYILDKDVIEKHFPFHGLRNVALNGLAVLLLSTLGIKLTSGKVFELWMAGILSLPIGFGIEITKMLIKDKVNSVDNCLFDFYTNMEISAYEKVSPKKRRKIDEILDKKLEIEEPSVAEYLKNYANFFNFLRFKRALLIKEGYMLHYEEGNYQHYIDEIQEALQYDVIIDNELLTIDNFEKIKNGGEKAKSNNSEVQINYPQSNNFALRNYVPEDAMTLKKKNN